MDKERMKFKVKCNTRCWDGKNSIQYIEGQEAMIDPLDPIAKYFEGWPPGTEVYTKEKGKEGTRVIPGGVGEGEVGDGNRKTPKKIRGKKVT